MLLIPTTQWVVWLTHACLSHWVCIFPPSLCLIFCASQNPHFHHFLFAFIASICLICTCCFDLSACGLNLALYYIKSCYAFFFCVHTMDLKKKVLYLLVISHYSYFNSSLSSRDLSNILRCTELRYNGQASIGVILCYISFPLCMEL